MFHKLSDDGVITTVFYHADVRTCARQFDIESFHNDLYREHAIALPQSVAGALKSRRANYLAGRYVCNQILQGYGATTFEVGIGERNRPDWPLGYVGSISHTSDMAAAVIAPSNSVASIGLDIEYVLEESALEAVLRRVVDEHELDRLATYSDDVALVSTIAFSAKECIYKALYPLVNEFFYFEAAKVTAIDESEIVLCLQKNLSDKYRAGHSFSIRFGISDSQDRRRWVATGLVVNS